VGGWPGWYDLC